MPIIELLGGLAGCLLGAYLLSRKQKPDTRIADAEAYIRSGSGALYRHYCIPEVKRHVAQWAHVTLTDDEAMTIVQKIRDEKGMGPIAYYNLPEWKEQ